MEPTIPMEPKIPPVNILPAGGIQDRLDQLGVSGLSVKGKMTPKRLHKVCEDFEAIFIKQLLEEMRKTLSNGGLMGKGIRAEIYQDMFDEQVALKMAKAGGIGIGEKLYRALAMRFKNELASSPKSTIKVKDIRDHIGHSINPKDGDDAK